MKQSYKFVLALLLIVALSAFQICFGQSVFTAKDLLGIERCRVQALNPDDTELIFSVSTPRGANEKPGSAHSKYYKINLTNNESSLLFEEDIKVGSPRYSPDGSYIAFTYKKEKDHKQVWAIPADGGDTVQLTHAKNDVNYFRWQPDGQGIAYLSTTPRSVREIELKKRGYDFIFYEENLKKNQLFVIRFDTSFKLVTQQQMLKDTHVWDFEFSPDGQLLSFSTSEKNLIDYRYMFRKIKILDMSSGEVVKEVGNTGKLGNYVFNPEGSQLAFTSALNMNDHAVSQAFTYSLKNETIRNHTPANFNGHISWVGWKNNKELLCYSGEGVYPKLSGISVENDKYTVMLDSETSGVIFGVPLFTEDCQLFVFTSSTPDDPSNIYTWNGSGDLNKVTDLNPQLSGKLLGEQEVIRYKARDGMEIEGLLIKPVGYDSNKKYPLILYVHGGPEWHHRHCL